MDAMHSPIIVSGLNRIMLIFRVIFIQYFFIVQTKQLKREESGPPGQSLVYK